MNLTANHIARINSSASEGASNRAREMIAAGVDLISLAVGEPDFETPDHVIEAAIAAMKAGQTRYTGSGGTAELKAAIIGKFSRDNGLDYRPQEIIASAGAKNIIYLALLASLNPGDEVIVPAPHWVSYTDMTVLAGGVPVVVPCTAQENYKLGPEALEAAITPRSRWLLLNTPGNPTGAVYTREDIEALAGVLRRHPHVAVMTDEIYEHILFDGLKFHSFASVAPDLKNRVLTVNGVSKAYAMTGWRIGYAGGPEELIASMKKVQSQTIGSICSISQAASVAALNGPQDYLAERSALFQQRRDRIMALLAGIPGLTCRKPEGAFYLYVGCEGLLGKRTPQGKVLETDADVSAFLLEEGRVMTVNGAAYGLSPFFRLSIATSIEKLEDAGQRIAAAVARLS